MCREGKLPDLDLEGKVLGKVQVLVGKVLGKVQVLVKKVLAGKCWRGKCWWDRCSCRDFRAVDIGDEREVSGTALSKLEPSVGTPISAPRIHCNPVLTHFRVHSVP